MEPTISVHLPEKKVSVGVQQTGESPLVETIQTIKEGGVPSNVQLEHTFEKTKEDIERQLEKAPVSEKGIRLAKDAEQVLNAAENFIEEKNKDELLQQTIIHAREGAKEAAVAAKELKHEGERKLKAQEVEIQKKAVDVYYLGRRLARQVISSREFRKLLLEFGELMSDIIGKRTEKLKEEGERVKQALKTDFVEGKLSSTLEEIKSAKQRVQEEVSKPEAKEEQEPIAQLTEDEKRELAVRFRNLLREVSKQPDYAVAVNALLDLIEYVKHKAEKLVEMGQESREEIRHRENIRLLWNDVRHIIERFSGEKRMDVMLNEVNALFNDLKNDPVANRFWNEFTLFIRDSITNPQLLDADEAVQKTERLIDLARSTFNDPQYELRIRRILLESRDILNRIQYDPATERLTSALTKFARDFVSDWKGQPSIGAFSDSMKGFREVLLPVIVEQLQHIPVARIEGSSKTYDYVLDNIHFSAYDILPEHVKLELYSKVDIALKESRTDKAKAKLELDLKHIKTHLKNLRFAYRRKEFPKMEDEGIADIDIAGDGTNIFLYWKIVTGEEVPMRFVMKEVRCKIDNMKITIKEAKHSVLDSMMMKLWNKRMKKILEEEVEFNLRFVGHRIADIFNDAIYNFNTAIYNINLTPLK